jgi:hypothetical protein
MTKRPTFEQLGLAAEWLDMNEGDGGEAEACKAVAEWIMAQAVKFERDHAAREFAKEKGLDMKTVRAMLRKHANPV